MKTGNRIVAAAFGGALCLAASSGLSHADETSAITMTPMKARSFELGSKHVLSYFLGGGGQCRLTLMINDAGDETSAQVSRVQLSVDPGKSARLDTLQGASVAFNCDADAFAMSVQKLDRLAAYPAAE